MPGYRPRVLVDFDGVLHGYSRGWADGSVYDPPMPGAREAMAALDECGYEVVVFSTRDAAQIRAALDDWGWTDWHPLITDRKLPAVALVDDRAVRFTDWDQAIGELADRYPIRDEETR